MKLDLNFPIKNLDGTEIPNTNAGKIIADILATKSDGISAIKAIDTAIKLYNGESVDFDKDDMEKLKLIVENAALVNLVKAAVLTAIDTTINNG